MKHILFISFFILCFYFSLFSEQRPQTWYTDNADAAIKASHFQRAVSLLEEAKRYYPENVQWYLMLGDMYSDNSLYNLAKAEYRAALALEPQNYDALHSMGETYKNLDMTYDAVASFETLHGLNPNDRTIILELGWLYFKANQFHKGISLLENYTAKHEADISSTMTLATLYAGLYEYQRSKDLYLEAIDMAKKQGYTQSASIGHYNLSILESRFYQYNSAFAQTQLSLIQRRRAPGYISQGDLFFQQLDYKSAAEALKTAYNLDETPLSLLSLAELNLYFGRLSEAKTYISIVKDNKDVSWMQRFGTNTHKMNIQIYSIISDIHYSEANIIRASRNGNIFYRIGKFFLELYHRFLSQYYTFKEMHSRRIVADQFYNEGNKLDAYKQYWQIFSQNRGIALKYLAEAKRVEGTLNPRSIPHYDLAEAIISNKKELYINAIEQFDFLWEKKDIINAKSDLLKFHSKNLDKNVYNSFLSSIFLTNPAAFLMHNISFPVSVANKQRYDKYFNQTLLELSYNSEFSQYELHYSWDADKHLSIQIKDKNNSVLIFTRNYHGKPFHESIKAFIFDFFEIFN